MAIVDANLSVIRRCSSYAFARFMSPISAPAFLNEPAFAEGEMIADPERCLVGDKPALLRTMDTP
jgi:hypothetical protein